MGAVWATKALTASKFLPEGVSVATIECVVSVLFLLSFFQFEKRDVLSSHARSRHSAYLARSPSHPFRPPSTFISPQPTDRGTGARDSGATVRVAICHSHLFQQQRRLAIRAFANHNGCEVCTARYGVCICKSSSCSSPHHTSEVETMKKGRGRKGKKKALQYCRRA